MLEAVKRTSPAYVLQDIKIYGFNCDFCIHVAQVCRAGLRSVCSPALLPSLTAWSGLERAHSRAMISLLRSWQKMRAWIGSVRMAVQAASVAAWLGSSRDPCSQWHAHSRVYTSYNILHWKRGID